MFSSPLPFSHQMFSFLSQTRKDYHHNLLLTTGIGYNWSIICVGVLFLSHLLSEVASSPQSSWLHVGVQSFCKLPSCPAYDKTEIKNMMHVFLQDLTSNNKKKYIKVISPYVKEKVLEICEQLLVWLFILQVLGSIDHHTIYTTSTEGSC